LKHFTLKRAPIRYHNVFIYVFKTISFKTQYRVNTVSMATRKKSQLTKKSQPASRSKEP